MSIDHQISQDTKSLFCSTVQLSALQDVRCVTYSACREDSTYGVYEMFGQRELLDLFHTGHVGQL